MHNGHIHWAVTLASLFVVATAARAAGPAIAEDPAFRAAWAAYKDGGSYTARVRNVAARSQRSASAPTSATARGAAWQATAIAAGTPSEICRVVRAHVRYVADVNDTWQSGRETWERGAGDCEDFAATVRDICQARGLDARLYVFHSETGNAAHAVTIGNWHGTLWMSSNGSYEVVSSVADAREHVMREMNWDYERVAAYEADDHGRLTSYTAAN